MRKVFLLIISVIFIFVLSGCNKKSATQIGDKSSQTTSGEAMKFETPKKSAHYESNTPFHGAVVAGVPVNVVIDFNFDLAKGSDISITKDRMEYGVGEVVIDENKLAMRRKMNPAAQDGVYEVNYKACWPDGSCHDGNFQFAVDRTKSSEFEDMLGKSEVAVRLSEIAFRMQNIRISAGTKVTWINDDEVEHYVNSDSHPAHTYFLLQNSQALSKGDSFSVTFDKEGIYPYHCSAHASSMTGAILVE